MLYGKCVLHSLAVIVYAHHALIVFLFRSNPYIQVLSVLDDHLAKRTFLVGQRITLADIVVAAKLSGADLSPQSQVYNLLLVLHCCTLHHIVYDALSVQSCIVGSR
jgi:Glutathione S-transferase, C-terminal domain